MGRESPFPSQGVTRASQSGRRRAFSTTPPPQACGDWRIGRRRTLICGAMNERKAALFARRGRGVCFRRRVCPSADARAIVLVVMLILLAVCPCLAVLAQALSACRKEGRLQWQMKWTGRCHLLQARRFLTSLPAYLAFSLLLHLCFFSSHLHPFAASSCATFFPFGIEKPPLSLELHVTLNDSSPGQWACS